MTPDVATAVKNAKAGQVQFRVDKAGIVHSTIGRRSFDNEKLQGNLAALIDALNKAKACFEQGSVPAQGGCFLHDGRWRPRGHSPSQRNCKRNLRVFREARCGGGLGVLHKNSQAIQDRWCALLHLIR